jgi:hypothetical protein
MIRKTNKLSLMILDDKDGKKEVIEHFDDKENRCLVELPKM